MSDKKVEISYNHDSKSFEIDDKPITFEKALEHWNAIDADWTVGAYNQMLAETIG